MALFKEDGGHAEWPFSAGSFFDPAENGSPWFSYRLPSSRLAVAEGYEIALIFVLLPRQKSEQDHLLRRDSLIFCGLADQ